MNNAANNFKCRTDSEELGNYWPRTLKKNVSQMRAHGQEPQHIITFLSSLDCVERKGIKKIFSALLELS